MTPSCRNKDYDDYADRHYNNSGLKENTLAVNSLGPNKGTLPANTVNSPVEAPSIQTPGMKDGSVRVALSSAARKMLDLQEDDSRDIDTKRVASLQAALAAGELQINVSRIADNILAMTQELLKFETGK